MTNQEARQQEGEPRETTSIKVRPSVWADMKIAAIRRKEDVSDTMEMLMLDFLKTKEARGKA